MIKKYDEQYDEVRVCVCAQSGLTLCDGIACQAPLGKNTGVGYHFLLQGLFPTQESNPCLLVSCLAGGFFTTSTTWETWASTYCLSFQWSNHSEALSWKVLMQVRQFPRHVSVHLKKKVNNDRGTPPMDGIDAPTIEGIFFFFLSTASSNIKSEFLGQLQLKSTYFRTQFVVSLAMLWHHVKVLTLKNRASKGVLILFVWFIFAGASVSLLDVTRVKCARERDDSKQTTPNNI